MIRVPFRASSTASNFFSDSPNRGSFSRHGASAVIPVGQEGSLFDRLTVEIRSGGKEAKDRLGIPDLFRQTRRERHGGSGVRFWCAHAGDIQLATMKRTRLAQLNSGSSQDRTGQEFSVRKRRMSKPSEQKSRNSTPSSDFTSRRHARDKSRHRSSNRCSASSRLCASPGLEKSCEPCLPSSIRSRICLASRTLACAAGPASDSRPPALVWRTPQEEILPRIGRETWAWYW